ncbi:tetratricopeptide repeat protein [Brachyspira innocens]|uniref:Tetratricopeptide repeat protein n=1 Tax=Brachyspira innocens TaxID=13264 RepID=A0ABT8YWB0_9SPIR|nr:tetratricopeptide repeat protein [Brachyspira innocens]MDO6993568.1 tetratricopeptide repeat protein [Brachyspira innocens]MDO7019488.1 tetratricopeptide repeat protein [Brachyspira innocens]
MEASLIVILVLIVLLGFATQYVIKSGSYPIKLKKIVQAYNEQNYDVAMREINTLDPKYKKDANILWMTANMYYKQQQYILAMAALQNMIDGAYFTKELTELTVREFLARIYEQTGNTKKAIDEYDMITKIRDNDYDSLFKAGSVCYQYGEWVQAQKYLSLAAAQNDSNPQLLYMLAECFYKIRSYHAAQQQIEKAIALDSTNAQYHLLLGEILSSSRDFQNAIKELEIAYESNEVSDKDTISLNLANSYYELGNYTKAREYYGQVLTKENIPNEKVVDERYRYAETLVKNKQFEAAVKQWEIIKSVRNIYLDVDQKLKTYSSIIANNAFRTALEMDIIEYLEKYFYRILTLNGYVVTDHTKKSDTLVFFVTIKKFGSEGQSYKSTFALDTSGYPMRQDTVDQFMEYARQYKSAHSFLISIGDFAPNLKVDDTVMIIEPDRFEAIIEGVISFSD